MTCDAEGPNGEVCQMPQISLRPYKNHPNHAVMVNGEMVSWPNTEFVPPPPQGSEKMDRTIGKGMRELASKISPIRRSH